MIYTLMKFKTSSSPSKLFSERLRGRAGSKISKMLYGFFLIFSLLISNSLFQGIGQPFVGIPEASAQSSAPSLFSTPGTYDFLSLAVAIMPTVQGADLNVTDIAGSTNCDLLVPITYLDATCMSSLPLLAPFTSQPNISEPVNQSVIYGNYSLGPTLALSIGVASSNVTAGDIQTVTVTVSDENSTEPILGAVVLSNITDSYSSVLYEYSGTTDDVGQVSFPFTIPVDAITDIYEVSVLASADGYDNATASTTFDVISSDDFFYDNSTSDDFTYDDTSSSDNCCSSSSDNSDFTSPTVKSVDPNDEQDNVPLNTEIKVTFDESMDQDTLDDGSLIIFNLDTGIDPGVNANPSSKSVTYTLDRQLEPGTRYEAELSFDIQDENFNYLDCSNSNDVDSSCRWQFDTTGTSGPVQVTDLNVTPISDTLLNLAWTANTQSDFNHYNVYRGTTAGFSITLGTTTPVGTPDINLFPDTGLTPSTVYYYRVAAVNDAGEIGPLSSEQSGETMAAITRVTPSNGAQNVSINANSISAKFSEPMQESTINENTFTLENNNASSSVTGTLTFSPDKTNATFTVSGPLNPSTVYTATIKGGPNGVKGSSGNPLATDEIWTFKTGDVNFASQTFMTTTAEAILVKPNQSNASIMSVNKSEVSNSVTKNNDSTISNSSGSANANVSDTSVGGPIGSIINNETFPNKNKSNASRSSAAFNLSDSIANTEPDTSIVDPNSVRKSEKSQSEPTSPESESNSGTFDAKVENKNDSENTQTRTNHNSITEQDEDKTITKVTSPAGDDRPDKQSGSSDSSPGDWALIYKYLHSGNDNAKREGQDIIKENNRPVAINDKAKTNADVPVNINILANDKDSDDDKLRIMGLSPPRQGTAILNPDGRITYSPLKSWAGTETFAYTISDGRGGVATASVAVIVQPTENHLPEAQDLDLSVNENSPVKIKLEAKDPDDDKLRFILVSKPSHGRIVQFSSSTGTLTYLPDENYDGKDDFGFKVHDGTVFGKNAEVSIKIEKNEKSSNDQQPNKEESSQTPTSEQKTNDEKSNNDTPPNDSNQQPPPSSQDNEQQKKDQKVEEQQSSQAEKPTSDVASSGDNQLTPDS
jgi:hypothetical protein